ncbi:uncharacterized protein LOC144148427 [Haemaphysalis longicornis]
MALPETLPVTAGRIIEVSLDDYITTINGLFNILEVCGGLILFFSLGNATEKTSERCLWCASYTFSSNGVVMIISSFLSATSAFYLPTLFYYVLFHGLGALMYIIPGIMLVKESKEVGMPAILSLVIGGFHAFHFSYVTYKKYVE